MADQVPRLSQTDVCLDENTESDFSDDMPAAGVRRRVFGSSAPEPEEQELGTEKPVRPRGNAETVVTPGPQAVEAARLVRQAERVPRDEMAPTPLPIPREIAAPAGAPAGAAAASRIARQSRVKSIIIMGLVLLLLGIGLAALSDACDDSVLGRVADTLAHFTESKLTLITRRSRCIGKGMEEQSPVVTTNFTTSQAQAEIKYKRKTCTLAMEVKPSLVTIVGAISTGKSLLANLLYGGVAFLSGEGEVTSAISVLFGGDIAYMDSPGNAAQTDQEGRTAAYGVNEHESRLAKLMTDRFGVTLHALGFVHEQEQRLINQEIQKRGEESTLKHKNCLVLDPKAKESQCKGADYRAQLAVPFIINPRGATAEHLRSEKAKMAKNFKANDFGPALRFSGCNDKGELTGPDQWNLNGLEYDESVGGWRGEWALAHWLSPAAWNEWRVGHWGAHPETKHACNWPTTNRGATLVEPMVYRASWNVKRADGLTVMVTGVFFFLGDLGTPSTAAQAGQTISMLRRFVSEQLNIGKQQNLIRRLTCESMTEALKEWMSFTLRPFNHEVRRTKPREGFVVEKKCKTDNNLCKEDGGPVKTETGACKERETCNTGTDPTTPISNQEVQATPASDSVWSWVKMFGDGLSGLLTGAAPSNTGEDSQGKSTTDESGGKEGASETKEPAKVEMSHVASAGDTTSVTRCVNVQKESTVVVNCRPSESLAKACVDLFAAKKRGLQAAKQRFEDMDCDLAKVDVEVVPLKDEGTDPEQFVTRSLQVVDGHVDYVPITEMHDGSITFSEFKPQQIRNVRPQSVKGMAIPEGITVKSSECSSSEPSECRHTLMISLELQGVITMNDPERSVFFSVNGTRPKLPLGDKVEGAKEHPGLFGVDDELLYETVSGVRRIYGSRIRGKVMASREEVTRRELYHFKGQAVQEAHAASMQASMKQPTTMVCGVNEWAFDLLKSRVVDEQSGRFSKSSREYYDQMLNSFKDDDRLRGVNGMCVECLRDDARDESCVVYQPFQHIISAASLGSAKHLAEHPPPETRVAGDSVRLLAHS